MSFKQFLRELNGSRIEGELINTFLYSLVAGLILFFGAFLMNRAFVETYRVYLLLAIITYSLLALTIRQVRAYKQFACMSGMMIGMTTGMIAGFLPGYYIGATNGMFIGGVAGMAIGIFVGIWNGRCCGIMGTMEGIMAGFMGGLMGAMTSVMLLNDHLVLATFIVTIVAWTIMVLLNYLIYFEMREMERQHHETHGVGVIFTAFITLATLVIVAYGPRSALVG